MNLATLCRFGNWLYRHHMKLLAVPLQILVFVIHGRAVKYTVRIGKGTSFLHKGFGVLINETVVIGRDCRIGNNVSIIGQTPYKHGPVLKDRVYVGPGAVIQGPCVIEEGAVIAPNSVVTRSVPAGAVVAGNPARFLSWAKDLGYDVLAGGDWDDSIKPYIDVK